MTSKKDLEAELFAYQRSLDTAYRQLEKWRSRAMGSPTYPALLEHLAHLAKEVRKKDADLAASEASLVARRAQWLDAMRAKNAFIVDQWARINELRSELERSDRSLLRQGPHETPKSSNDVRYDLAVARRGLAEQERLLKNAHDREIELRKQIRYYKGESDIKQDAIEALRRQVLKAQAVGIQTSDPHAPATEKDFLGYSREVKDEINQMAVRFHDHARPQRPIKDLDFPRYLAEEHEAGLDGDQ